MHNQDNNLPSLSLKTLKATLDPKAMGVQVVDSAGVEDVVIAVDVVVGVVEEAAAKAAPLTKNATIIANLAAVIALAAGSSTHPELTIQEHLVRQDKALEEVSSSVAVEVNRLHSSQVVAEGKGLVSLDLNAIDSPQALAHLITRLTWEAKDSNPVCQLNNNSNRLKATACPQVDMECHSNSSPM